MQRNGLSHSEAGKLGAQASIVYQEEQRLLAKAAYLANPRICKNCNLPIPWEKRDSARDFCSRSCSAIFHNIPRKIPRFCEYCKKELPFSKHVCSQKYCNSTCQKNRHWEDRKRIIIATGIVPNRNLGRKFLFETRGYACEQCKISTWNDQPVALVMDHINGNSCDNSLTNLRLLCCNCDAQTPTYKIKNKGNGRHLRRIRYAENKSY